MRLCRAYVICVVIAASISRTVADENGTKTFENETETVKNVETEAVKNVENKTGNGVNSSNDTECESDDTPFIPGFYEPDFTNLTGFCVLRIQARIKSQVDWLLTLENDPNLDFWTVPQVMENTDVMVSPYRNKSFINELQANNLEWSLLIPDMQIAVVAERARQKLTLRSGTVRATAFERYLRYEEVLTYLKELNERNSQVTQLQSIGITIQGRHIPVFIISTGGRNMRPLAVVDAGMHGNEWITTSMALYIIQQLLENAQYNELINRMDWHIIPIVNPDGYEYAHTGERLWRRNRAQSVFGFDANMGVDINRNFDYQWMKQPETSNTTGGKDYPGSNPFSEPESRAIRDILMANRKRASLYISFHSYGRHILYPWFYEARVPDNWDGLEELAQRANKEQWKVSGLNYIVGAGGRDYGPIPGTSTDWARGVVGVPLIYTVQLPGGSSQSYDPPSTDIHRIVSGFFPAVRVLAKQVIEPQFLADDYCPRLTPTCCEVVLCCVLMVMVFF